MAERDAKKAAEELSRLIASGEYVEDDTGAINSKTWDRVFADVQLPPEHTARRDALKRENR